MSKNRLTPKKDVRPAGKLRYEIIKRDLLHLKGGVEITVNLILDVFDDKNQPHRVNCMLSEDDFLKFTKEVALDIFDLKRRSLPNQQIPGAEQNEN